VDTGCSTTVCGTGSLDNYLENLSEYELSKVKEEPSVTTFTFGDGNKVSSIKKVVLRCIINNLQAIITTDVVDCNIPLLLSKQSMKKAGMCLNFENW